MVSQVHIYIHCFCNEISWLVSEVLRIAGKIDFQENQQALKFDFSSFFSKLFFYHLDTQLSVKSFA